MTTRAVVTPSVGSIRFSERIGSLVPFYYWAVLPALIATVAVVVLPLVYSFGMSFWHYILTDPANIRFAGLANYQHAFTDPTFRNSLGTTLIYGLGTVIVELVLGMLFAVVVNSLTFGQGLIRTAMLVPVFMTPAVVAFMWRFMLHPDLGIINYFLGLAGLGHPVWLGDPRLALPSVMGVEIWRNTPFMFLVFLAGMQSLPTELFEAAAVDGASFRQQFRHVTIPLLMPLILVAVIIRGMDALREFDTIFIMTGGGPGNATETIAISTYRYSFRNYDMGLGSAVSYVIFAIVFLFGLYFVRRMNRIRVD
ncbi:MAG: sugar ABC transporter permease [Chloroflexi bacterium]|nr:sugar ABC transporter permease [Chloroflexota bacterium]